MSKVTLLDRNDSLLLVIDPQGILLEKVKNSQKVIDVHKKIIKAAQILNVPILVTEHYPNGLGQINPAIVEVLGDDYKPMEKIIFSAFGDKKIQDAIVGAKKTVVVIGIESHICILQTVVDMLNFGLDVFVIEDAISARGELEHKNAIELMKISGAKFTTWESAVYQWMERADIPEFKKILPLLK